jgi:hypothetical protein
LHPFRVHDPFGTIVVTLSNHPALLPEGKLMSKPALNPRNHVRFTSRQHFGEAHSVR